MINSYNIAKQPVIETENKQTSSIDQNLNLEVDQKFCTPVQKPLNSSTMKHQCTCRKNQQLSPQINQRCKSPNKQTSSIGQNLNFEVDQIFMKNQCTCPKNQEFDDSLFNSFLTHVNECQYKENGNLNNQLNHKATNTSDREYINLN